MTATVLMADIRSNTDRFDRDHDDHHEAIANSLWTTAARRVIADTYTSTMMRVVAGARPLTYTRETR
jgi:hypothetical protein